MIIGYVRVSTTNQNLDIQLKALEKYHVDKLYEEKASGRTLERTALKECLTYIREGDTLIVYDLSRLGRSSKEVLELLDDFSKRNINFISIKENIDLATPTGRFFATVLSALNQLDLEMRNEKTKEGLQRAKENGIKLGRPRLNEKIIEDSLELYKKGVKRSDICRLTGISIASLDREIKKFKEKKAGN